MVQQQSPETQQDQGAGGGLPEKQEASCPCYHPGRGSGEGGLIQVPWGPNQQKTGLVT